MLILSNFWRTQPHIHTCKSFAFLFQFTGIYRDFHSFQNDCGCKMQVPCTLCCVHMTLARLGESYVIFFSLVLSTEECHGFTALECIRYVVEQSQWKWNRELLVGNTQTHTHQYNKCRPSFLSASSKLLEITFDGEKPFFYIRKYIQNACVFVNNASFPVTTKKKCLHLTRDIWLLFRSTATAWRANVGVVRGKWTKIKQNTISHSELKVNKRYE